MECPQCGSKSLQRDYAPPRTYALILVGLGLIFIARGLQPGLLLIEPAELGRFLVVGVIAVLLGGFDSVRHGNRFCLVCGTRCRARPRPAGAPAENVRPPRREAGGTERTLDPRTPVEPLLKCLRFKDPHKREEAAHTLARLTGQSFGPEAEAWENWWRDNRETYLAERAGRK